MTETNKSKIKNEQLSKSVGLQEVRQQGDGMAGLGGVEVEISVEWGRVAVPLEEARRLAVGSRLIAEQLASDPVDIRVNGKLFGRGRIVMVDEQYGVQLTEIIG